MRKSAIIAVLCLPLFTGCGKIDSDIKESDGAETTVAVENNTEIPTKEMVSSLVSTIPESKLTTTNTNTSTKATTTTTTTTPVFDPFSYATIGISVSSDNGYIDWNNVKSAGYSFGVIRAGSGDDLVSADPLFYVNMENAKSAGIYCGVYWQAKSVTEDGIIKEAEAFYNIIKDYSYEYPIYLVKYIIDQIY